MLLLALWWLFGGSYRDKIIAITNNKLALGFLLYFIITTASYLYTTNKALVETLIQHKLIFLLAGITMPFLLSPRSGLQLLFKWLLVSTVLASCYCMVIAVYSFYHSHNADVFFYHNLLLPLHLHAVYFSILVYLCLMFLVQQIFISATTRKWMYWPSFIFLNVMIVLLASKLILMVYVFSIALYSAAKFRHTKYLTVFGVITFMCIGIVLLNDNNVSRRFNDLSFNIDDALHKDKYGDDVYLDGLNYRLLAARFGAEIVAENKAWLFGVSAGDSQRLLVEKMQKAKLYKGYYEYNFHNQFIETYVQQGLIGLACLLFIFAVLIYKAFKLRYMLFSSFVIVFTAFAFTESFLQRQYGTFPFILLSLFFIKLSITDAIESDTNGINY